MTAEELLEELSGHDIQVGVVEGELRALDPDGKLTPALLSLLKKHKSELIKKFGALSTFTPSDFPNAASDITQEFLDQLQADMPLLDRLYVATPMQQGLIFHSLLNEDGSSYTGQMFGELVGQIDHAAFQQAWDAIVDRHDVFRTAFVGLDQETIHQAVIRKSSFRITLEDWRGSASGLAADGQLKAFREEDKRRGFDFQKPPLMRFTLIQIEDERHYFVWSHHHVLTDGWCLAVIFRELFAVYASLVKGEIPQLPPTTRFESFVSWLRKQDEPAALSFWETYLEGFEAVNSISSVNALVPPSESIHGMTALRLGAELSEEIVMLARNSKCTINTIIQAAWAYLLSRYTGDDDIVFGATVSGRPPDIPGIETMVGLFINSVPARVNFTEDQTIADLLATLHRDQISREENAHVALPDIQRVARQTGHRALFESLVVYQNYPPVSSSTLFEAGDGRFLRAENVSTDEQNNYPISLMILNTDTMRIECRFDRQHFEDKAVEQMMGHLENILRGFCAFGSSTPVRQISVLSEAETSKLLTDWSQGQNRDASTSGLLCHQMFEQWAAKSPEAIAAVSGKEKIDYRTLNEKANRLADYLTQNKLAPDSLVGICVSRSIEMIIAILGVWKAGSAWVPISADSPKERLQSIIADCAPSLCILDSASTDRSSFGELDVLAIDGAASDLDWLADYSSQNPNPVPIEVAAKQLAYVMFTSGSTGKPKGVMIEHKNLLHYINQAAEDYFVSEIEGSVVSSSLGFDATLTAILPSLITGRTLYLTDAEDADLSSLAATIEGAAKPLLFKLTPSHLDALTGYFQDGPVSSLGHHVVVGGEQWSSRSALEWATLLPGAKFTNEYGPTETVVGCCVYEFMASDAHRTLAENDSVPIGRPMANTQLYVLSKDLKPTPPGCSGELYIGGEGVARGYLGREELTKEKFIASPFEADESKRLYRTGDLVRYLDNGELLFVGRNDQQVKIRGHRVELGEIEQALQVQSDIQEAVVVASEVGGQTKLFAFVTGDNSNPSPNVILSELAQSIPYHALPSSITALDKIPLTSNGKIDRKALEALCCEDVRREIVQPTNEKEKLLCDIWRSVLGREDIGTEDSFFELGGDSILSIQVSARAKSKGMTVTVRDIFELQTVAAIAAQTKAPSPNQAKNQLSVGQQEMLPFQQAYFFDHQEGPHRASRSLLIEIAENLNPSSLSEAVRALYHRHDAFRLRFREEKQTWSASYAEYGDKAYEEFVDHFDLAGLDVSTRERELKERCERLQNSFDLCGGSPIQLAFFSFGSDQRGYILLTTHDVAFDRISQNLLVDELVKAIKQVECSEEPDLGPRPPSFQEWGERVSQLATEKLAELEIPLWKRQLKDVPEHPWEGDVPSTDRKTITKRFSLPGDKSDFLLGPAHKVYRTKGHELLLSAFYAALSSSLGQKKVLFYIESDGREKIFDDFDAIRTVGCFTSVHPLAIDAGPETDIGEVIKSTKECCRSIPNGGIGYGALLASRDYWPTFAQDAEVRANSISFSYLGQSDGSFLKETAAGPAQEFFGSANGFRQETKHPLNVDIAVHEGIMNFCLSGNTDRISEAKLERLTVDYENNVRKLIQHCVEELELMRLNEVGREVLNRKPTLEDGIEVEI